MCLADGSVDVTARVVVFSGIIIMRQVARACEQLLNDCCPALQYGYIYIFSAIILALYVNTH